MAMNDAPRCTHIKIDGRRCGSPALRGEFFCYFHTNLIKGVHGRIDCRFDDAAMFESPEHIQYSLMEVFHRITRGEYDHRRAALILRTLHLAVQNSRRVNFNRLSLDPVRELPDYRRQYFAEHPEHCTPEEQVELEPLRRQYGLKLPTPTAPKPARPDEFVEDPPQPSTPKPSGPPSAKPHSPNPQTPNPQTPSSQPPAPSSPTPAIPPQNGKLPTPELKPNPAATHPNSPQAKVISASSQPQPAAARTAPSNTPSPALTPPPITLNHRQSTQWEKLKPLRELASRASHGASWDIADLMSELRKLTHDHKVKV